MNDASLIHRGEQFRYVEDGEPYEGECVWAWEPNEPGAVPRRTYPITIDVRSIRATGTRRPVRVDRDRQRYIAGEVKRILEAREPGCELLLFE